MRSGRDRRGRQAFKERTLIGWLHAARLALAFDLVLAGPAWAAHRDELFTFATALAVGRVVPVQCSDIIVDRSGLEQLGKTLHITPTDLMATQIQTRIITKFFSDQADKAGAKDWCEDVYKAYGPEGTLMRGYLSRR